MTPWVGQLLVANIIVFLGQMALPPLTGYLALVPGLLLQRPWTLITYMFLHGGVWHLAFNMIALYFFGPRLEARLGSKRFLGLYFASGIAGALLSFLLGFTPFASLYVPIVGASGAIFGVLFAFAKYWPHERIYIWALFPLEARVFVIGITVLSLYFGFTGTASGVAHFAHLGGFAGGWAFLKASELTSPARRFQQKAASSGSRMGDREVLARWRRIDREALHEVNRAEYDRIAAKIEREGATSLNERERTFIDRFSPD